METESRKTHWEKVYSAKGEAEVSWFQQKPEISVELVLANGGSPASGVIDIGGGASRLVDELVARRFTDLTVLDLSEAALATAKARLGMAADRINWVVADITEWRPSRTYDIWHDRAAFHFLTEPSARAAYLANLTEALKPGGTAIIATFALDGPEKCSGLPIVRYDPESLAAALGGGFRLIDSRKHHHVTPWGSDQSFQFSVFTRQT